MDELEALRQRKLAELQEEQRGRQELQTQIAQLEAAVKQYLTKEAAERYHNIKAANPALAVQALVLLSQAMQKRPVQVDDRMLKQFMMKVVPEKREIKITRK